MRLSRRIVCMLLFVVAFATSGVATWAEDQVFTGTVVEVQKYGNLTMDLAPSVLYDGGFELGDVLEVTFGNQQLEMPFVTSYSDVDTGNLLVRDDQGKGLLVVAINMGNFSTTYGVEAGDQLTFEILEKEGYLSQYLLHQLERTNVRSDYATDSIYANFRSIATTGIQPGVLYRSSNPANNELNRAAYANALTEAVGIQTVVNLADSGEELEGYFAETGFNSMYYKNLYQSGQVKALDMGVDLLADDFGSKLVEGLQFMATHDGPYLVHCTEGKDRAGFVSALLEALMGASMDEITADYMTTYKNYYKVEEGTEQYEAIAESNIVTSMTTIVAGLEKGSDLTGVDMAKAAANYLKGLGMTAVEIEALKGKLSAAPYVRAISMTGIVEEIEKYGHTSTSIKIDDFNEMGFELGDMAVAVFDNGFVVEAPYLDGYFVDTGYPLVRAYPGHTNIAVCINYGKLYEIADVEIGDSVTIMRTVPQGYELQYAIRKLARTNERADYATDAIFANFREVSLGEIANGIIYRSSSPINNELGRAAYANKLIASAGVMTVVNMADSEENILDYRAAEDFNSAYYAKLYDQGKVMTLNMSLAYGSEEFQSNIVKGLVFMSENEGPYLFHCTEGKDRTGFMGALLGALMGASKEEIVADYMLSYDNYYGVKPGSEKYAIISGDVLQMLKDIADTDNLDTVNLSQAAESYLLAGGMSKEQIDALKSHLMASGPTLYRVLEGDNLWRIANKQLGDGNRFMEIYNLNKQEIKNPDLIYEGQSLEMPMR